MRLDHTSTAYEEAATPDYGDEESVTDGSVYSGYDGSGTRSAVGDHQETQSLGSAEWQPAQQDPMLMSGMPADAFAEHSGGPVYPPQYGFGFDRPLHHGNGMPQPPHHIQGAWINPVVWAQATGPMLHQPMTQGGAGFPPPQSYPAQQVQYELMPAFAPNAMPPNAMPPNAMPPNAVPPNVIFYPEGFVPHRPGYHPGPWDLRFGPPGLPPVLLTANNVVPSKLLEVEYHWANALEYFPKSSLHSASSMNFGGSPSTLEESRTAPT
ncbi:hypothetical protein VTO73DRAFT_14455 [Trametes versicolor]